LHRAGSASILNNFSVAPAFTPGDERMLSFKSPINGAFVSPPEKTALKLVVTIERSVERERPDYSAPIGEL
jgi:hypothetical protein